MGETSNSSVKSEKNTKQWQLKELKSKGVVSRFPLKSNIFGEIMDELFSLFS